MQQDTAKRVVSAHHTAHESPAESNEQQALSALMADIAGDAALEPAQYLRETIVPEGGE